MNRDEKNTKRLQSNSANTLLGERRLVNNNIAAAIKAAVEIDKVAKKSHAAVKITERGFITFSSIGSSVAGSLNQD